VVNIQPSPGFGPSQIITNQLGGKLTDPANPFGDVTYYNFDSTNRIESAGGSAHLEYSMGLLKLTSLTSYRDTRVHTTQDSDFSSADLLGEHDEYSRIKTFTQELRAATDWDGPFNALIGAFYFNEKINQNNTLKLGSQFRPYANFLIQGATGGAFNVGSLNPQKDLELILGGLDALAQGTYPATAGRYVGQFFGNGQGLTEGYRLRNESFSIFSQIDLKVSDRLTLTGGINYTHDRKRFTTDVSTTDVFSTVDVNSPNYAALRNQLLLGGALQQAGIDPTDVGAVTAFATAPLTAPAYQQMVAFAAANESNPAFNPLNPLRGLQFLPPFMNLPNAVETGRVSDGHWSFTARAAYDVSDAINVYASFATGYKAASVNLSRDSKPFPSDRAAIVAAGLAVPNLVYTTRYAPAEDATVYEAGLKAKWGTTSVNLAVFKQSIKGFQSNLFTGTGFVLTGAGKQSTWGVEFEGMAKPVDQLTLNMAATYLKPKYDSFLVSAFGDLSGTRPAGIPTWSTTVGFSWEQPIANGDTLFLRADYHYESPYQSAEGLPNFLSRLPNGNIDPASIPVALAAARQFRRDVHEVNASATWAMQNGLELGVWGRNLTNHRYIGQFFDSPAQQGSVSGYPNQPRTYGISARYKF